MVRDLAGRARALLPNFGRFLAVGTTNAVVDFGTFNLLLHLAGGDEAVHLFPYFTAAGFCAALVNSYLLNRTWTFRAEKKSQSSREFAYFLCVTVSTFLVNLTLSTFLVWARPFPWIGTVLWANVAKAAATGVQLVLNFSGYQFLVFRKRPVR